jgi:hypothetical protein
LILNGFTISSAAVRCPKHGGEQSWEQLVELNAAQLVHMGGPVRPGANDARITQHPEMVRHA